MERKGNKTKEVFPSLLELQKHKTNPFVLELEGKMILQPKINTFVAKGEAIINKETGELVEGENVMIGRRRIVDKSQFAKIYASEVGILFDLSKPAIKLFMHLTKVMDYENKAMFRYAADYAEIGYKSHVPLLKAIKELLARDIIAPHILSGLWWLNPTIVCKGERFAVYTEYMTQEKAEEVERKKREINEKSGKILTASGESWDISAGQTTLPM